MITLTNLTGTGRALFSDDRRYRYLLERRWSDATPMGFVALNASTADHERDDPTVTRMVNFAKRHGAGGLLLSNLSPLVATDPRELYAELVKWPDGRTVFPTACNQFVVEDCAERCWRVVAAFGSYAGAPPAARRALDGQVRVLTAALAQRVIPWWCLDTTAGGYPRHPLYLPGNASLQLWRGLPADVHTEPRTAP